MSASQHQPKLSRNFAILAITTAIAAVFFSMIQSFLIALFLAAVFSAMAYPLCSWIAVNLGGRMGLAAALTLLLLISAILLPGIALLLLVAEQAQDVGQQAIPWVKQQMQAPAGQNLQLPDWLPFHKQLAAYAPTVATKIGELSTTIGEFAVSAITSLTSDAAQFLLNLFVMLYAMFYFLKEGPALLDGVERYALSLGGVQKRVFQRAVVVTRATVKGTLVIGIVQGFLGGLGFWMFGVGGAAFWGAVMVIASMLPVIGTSLIWIPGVIFLLATGETTPAIGLALWSAIIVSNIDNVLRPILVGGDTEMPDLLVLISTFGGLGMFGGAGLIVGPVLAAVTMTLLDISHETLKDPSAETPGDPQTATLAKEPHKPPAPQPAKGPEDDSPGLLEVGLSEAQKKELELLKKELADMKSAKPSPQQSP